MKRLKRAHADGFLGPQVEIRGRLVGVAVGLAITWVASAAWGVTVFENPLDVGYAITLAVIGTVLVAPGAVAMLALRHRNPILLGILLLPIALSAGFALARSDDSSTAGINLFLSPLLAGGFVGAVLLLEFAIDPPSKNPPPPPGHTS